MEHRGGFIVIDTEGTGLFMHRDKATGEVIRSDAPGQPRMASFGAILINDDFEIEDRYHALIYPSDWKNADGSLMEEMPEEAFKIHGLSFDDLLTKGVPAATALEVYVKAIKDGRAVLGYNQQHDGRQIRAELRHAGLDDMFETTLNTCVMRSLQGAGIKIKKLNGKGGFPRLMDAAAHFGVPYDESENHDALRDALVTHHIASQIRDHLLEPAVHRAAGMKDEE